MRLGLSALMLLFSLQAQAKEWLFAVALDGKPIGQHSFVLDDTTRELTSKADFKVKILFIEAYQYAHVAKEQWSGNCLTSLDARTVENRVVTQVNGKLADDHLVVEVPQGKPVRAKQSLPACSMSFPYWNPAILQQQHLLNPQTGEWLAVNTRLLGRETIQVRDQQVLADHYRLEATKLKIDLWYSPAQDWLALTSTTPEGYVITYRLK